MEAVVHAAEGTGQAVRIPDVADVELEPRVRVPLPHVVLLLLVPAEYPHLANIRLQEPAQDRVTERARSAGDEQHLVFKHL